MEQAGPLGGGHVLADLGGHEAGQLGHLDGVVVHVLAVAGAVLHAADELDELGVQAHDVGLQHGPLALGFDGGVHFPFGGLHHLLDAGGVDAAVQDELFQGQPGDLPADGVKAGHGDGLRGVVDDEVHAGEGFQGADVPAFPADDPPFHLVVGQGDHRDGDLGHMVGGAPLDGQAHDLLGLGVGLLLEAGLDLFDLHGGLVGDLGLQFGDEVFLGLLGGVAGDPFQGFHLLGLEFGHLDAGLLQVGQAGGVGFLLPLHVFQLPLQGLFLLLETAFLLLQFGAAFLGFSLVVGFFCQDFLLGFHQGFPFFALGALDGLVDDAFGLFLGADDLLFRHFLAVEDAHGDPYHKRDDEGDHADQDIGQHIVGTHLPFY